MKKFLLFVFAALAFVACDKEEDKPNWSFPKISPTPVYSCLDNSGMIIEVKSDIPSNIFEIAIKVPTIPMLRPTESVR